MLTNPSSGRRTTGRLMVLATLAVALPLTATRAIEYIDIPAPSVPLAAASASIAHVAAVAQPAEPAAPAEPAEPAPPATPLNIDRDGIIMFNGQQKQWRDLTPAEKAEIRASIARAKEDVARARIDREEIRREMRKAMDEARFDKEEFRRDMADARIEIEQAVREVDAHAADIRRAGQDPEQIKAQVRASLKAVEAIDVEAITRSAMASVDVEAAVAAAEAGVAQAQAEIERLEQRFEKDE